MGQKAQKVTKKAEKWEFTYLKHHTCVSHQPFHSTEREKPARTLTTTREGSLTTFTLDTPPPNPSLKKVTFFNEGQSTFTFP